MKQKIAILSLCFTGLMYLVITVSLAGMINAFSYADPSVVKLVISLPSLTGILGIWAVPVLAGKVRQKSICTFALGLLCFAGLSGLFVHKSLYAILTASALIGFAYGIITTMYPVLIAARYHGAKQAAMMGFGAGMLQLGRLLSSLLAGELARQNWWGVFGSYGFALVALVLFVLLMPKDELILDHKSARDTASLKNPDVWKLAVFGSVFACFYFVISTDSSIYIESAGLGTARFTGILASVACAVAGGVAAMFGKIYKKTGRFTLPAAFLMIGIGYLYAGLKVSRFSILTASVASAVGISVFTPWLMTVIAPAAKKQNAPVATALILTVVNLGYTLSPYVTGFLGQMVPFGFGPFFAAGAVALAMCIISAVSFQTEVV